LKGEVLFLGGVFKTISSWLSTGSCAVKLDEEKFKNAGLAQAKWFSFSIIAQFTVGW
jgi:hypothetical protein